MNNAINTVTQYASYVKPSWAPPAAWFGPVWTVLYAIIAVSFGFVIYKYLKKEVNGKTALPFLLNLVFNFLFTWIQFGLGSFALAALDIALVLVTLIWALFAIEKKYTWVMIVNLPYLGWVSFATVLQLTVAYLNR